MQNTYLLFAGDPHSDFLPIFEAVDRHSPGAVIILGDLDLYLAPFELFFTAIRSKTKLFFIPGNHDYDEQEAHDNLLNLESAHRNLHGRVVDIDGVRVAGLGGVFVGRVWNPSQEAEPRYKSRSEWLKAQPSNVRRGGMPLKIQSAIWHEDVERLATQRADILVSHEAPSCHQHGFAIIDELALAMGVKKIFHGHHHQHYTARLPNGIVVHGAGLAQVLDLDGELQ